jgi:hypothetical protein
MKFKLIKLYRNIYELWGVGKTYEEIHSQVKAKPERWVSNPCLLFGKTSF